MSFFIVSIIDPDLEDILGQIVGEDFSLSRDRAQLLITKEVMRHLKRFHDDTKIVIERNYVD